MKLPLNSIENIKRYLAIKALMPFCIDVAVRSVSLQLTQHEIC